MCSKFSAVSKKEKRDWSLKEYNIELRDHLRYLSEVIPWLRVETGFNIKGEC